MSVEVKKSSESERVEQKRKYQKKITNEVNRRW